MSLIVLKFGGTSVGSIKKINHVAEIIKKYRNKKKKTYCCFISNGRCYE